MDGIEGGELCLTWDQIQISTTASRAIDGAKTKKQLDRGDQHPWHRWCELQTSDVASYFAQ